MKSLPSGIVFLPIVVRELRAAARRPRTYYARMTVAAIWVAAAAYVVIVTSVIGIGKHDGLALFRSLSGALFAWALFSAWAGSDSISLEKREGTIGLLFLTDLKCHDIVLGKMVASAVPAFCAALAALPLLAICLVMGGVTASQYAKTALAILNIFFLGQAIGMFSSSLCRLRGNATGLPMLILLSYLTALGLTTWIAEVQSWDWLAVLVQQNNPARPFYLASQGSSARGPAPGYWATLLVTDLHAWFFMGLAIRVLPRRWRENPKKAGFWKTNWERWRFGNMAARTAFRTRLVSVNPILWLICRGRFGPAFAWSVMGLVA
jgi:ABC-type transport system involved in cytochrome c biogenesis permease component